MFINIDTLVTVVMNVVMNVDANLGLAGQQKYHNGNSGDEPSRDKGRFDAGQGSSESEGLPRPTYSNKAREEKPCSKAIRA